MRTLSILLLISLLTLITMIGSPSSAVATSAGLMETDSCQEGTLPSGALWLICIPSSGWNGDLVVFAHGYVAFNEPLAFHHLQLGDAIFLPDLVQDLGYAFATTSYRQNGLAVLEGADDIRELVEHFPTVPGAAPPRHTYLTGASEGGLVTTLLLEQSPELFSGGLAACGPIGNFRSQLNYFGDFRVLFDYFFPGVIPGTAINIPSDVIENWDDIYVPAITQAIENDAAAARQLMRTSTAAVDPLDPSTMVTTSVNLLWYNVFATNDAVQKLGGNPYNNIGRWYRGSRNDIALNRNVKRFALDAKALATLARHQTTGQLSRPLVTMHTVGDEIIPFWHQRHYRENVELSGNGRITPFPIVRYGHCEFTPAEALVAFGLLVWQVTGTSVDGIPSSLVNEFVRRYAS